LFSVRILIFGWWIIPIMLLAITDQIDGSENFVTIDENVIQQAEKQYGASARKRLLAWQELMRTHDSDVLNTLKKVNHFFNVIPFVSDATHWGVEDYWATPIEFLASNGGDCEDFATAKYFTLTALGVSEKRLTLTYVKALRLGQTHLVLAYYPAPDEEPLVLDNLVDTIELSSRRTDLLPVYSFNASGLWMAKQRGKGEVVGEGRRIRPWRELLARMRKIFPQK